MVVFRRIVFSAAAVATIGLVGCRDVTDPGVGEPSSIAPLAGDAQTVAAGSAVSPAPSVKVTDTRGDPVPGITVTFAVASGGGSVTGATAMTDANGIATVGGWTLGTTAGTNTLTASVGSLTVTFTTTAVAGAATSLAPVAGTAQNATVNTSVGVAPSVIAKDAHGNPVANVAVTFAVGTSGGAVTGASQTTNAQGVATVGGWTVGQTAGSYSLIATAGALTTTFTATALPGPPATILPLAGNDQVAPASAKVIVSPSVVVKDAFGNSVPNVTVTFSVESGGGTVTGATQSTNSDGVATVGAWTVGPQPGNNSLAASSGGVAASFTATAIPSGADGSLRFTAVIAGGGAWFPHNDSYSCALDVGGRAWCWGSNGSGQLGDGTTLSRSTPFPVGGSPTYALITAGLVHTCGLTAAGVAYCWGSNSEGQLGDDTSTRRTTPVKVSGVITFKALDAGAFHTCGLTSAGAAYCWGKGAFGRLGSGDSSGVNRPVPAAVQGGLVFQSLGAGDVHTCGIADLTYCWGGGPPYWGQLGDGTRTEGEFGGPGVYPPPRTVPHNIGYRFTRLFVGANTTCGLDSAGTARCWGTNYGGQLGDGTWGNNRSTPELVSGGLNFADIAIGGRHTCGRLATGALRCWGTNYYGEFGNGQTVTIPVTSPVNGANGMTFASVAAGNYHTCGLDLSGKVYCWGNNQFGQLGDGTTVDRATPVAVVFP